MSNTPYSREIVQILKDNLAAIESAIAQLRKRVISTRELEQAAEQTRTLIAKFEGRSNAMGGISRPSAS